MRDFLPLLQFCSTDRQREIVHAMQQFQGQRSTARALGVDQNVVHRIMKSLRNKAALRGHAPEYDMKHMVPDGFNVKGVSTYYNREGKPAGQWVKSSASREAMIKAIQETVDALKSDLPKAAPVCPPASVVSDLCNLYTFTDYHLGMYAWREEGGDDWDVAIAEKTIMAAQKIMIDSCQPAEMAIINIQGDFLHTDGKLPVTPASKHVLDADTRYPKIRRAAIRIIRQMVSLALERHSRVHLVIAEGNHDEEGAGWLSDLFAVHYEDDSRVTVNDSVLPFYCIQFGDCMIGVHHGHKVKNEQLPLLFAAQYAEIWGRTKRREIHCGHRHHRDEKEYNGVTVVQHPTLAARDAYAARGGWIADRAAWAITYHRKYGPVGRVMITPEMIRDSVPE